MGEQARLIEDQLRHCGDVVDRGSVAIVSQPLRCDWIAILWCLAESKQRLVATNTRSSDSEGADLRRREVGRLEAGRRLSEGAVATAIPTEHREGDEDLWRIGHPDAECLVANGPGLGHQLLKRGVQP